MTAEISQEAPVSVPTARRRWPWLLALVLVVGLLVAAVTLGLRVRAVDAEGSARQEALAAATAAAAGILSYDHRSIDADIARAQELGTGRFLEQYRATTTDLAEQARAGQAVVTATVQASSVVAGDADRVVVLLFVDQLTSRVDQAEPRLDQNRLRLTLDLVDGRWLVSELDAL